MKIEGVKNIKEINKIKILKDIFISKYGLNYDFCNSSDFIHKLFSKYLRFFSDIDSYFYEDKIICSSDIIGTSPYTLTITEDGNLKVTYFYETISDKVDWPQHFKYNIEVLYLATKNGYKEITKKSHLYKGKSRTKSVPEGEMVSKLDSIDIVMREFEGNIETKRIALVDRKDKTCDIDEYQLPKINNEDIERLEKVQDIIMSCKTLSTEEIKNILVKEGVNSISLFERDEAFKEKATYRRIDEEDGYTKNVYNLIPEMLNELIISNSNNIWSGIWSKDKIEFLFTQMLNRIGYRLLLPYDYDKIDIFLSLLKHFVGRINYNKIKLELEQKISVAHPGTDKEDTYVYDIEDGQIVKRITLQEQQELKKAV